MIATGSRDRQGVEMRKRLLMALVGALVASCTHAGENDVPVVASAPAVDTQAVVSSHVDVADDATDKDQAVSSQCAGAAWCVSTVAGGGKLWQDGPALQVLIHSPSAIAVADSGVIYISERETAKPLRKLVDGQLRFIATATSAFIDPPPRFWLPESLAFDANRRLLIGDHSHRIRRLHNGEVRVVMGASPLPTHHNKLPIGGFKDGPMAEAQFNIPTGIAVDSKGRMAIADLGNKRVRVMENGVVSTVHKMQSQPWGLAFGPDDSLYVVDRGAHRILRIANGKVTTHAGTGQSGHVDGPAAQATFSTPHGVAVDDSGRVFVSDWGSSTIRVIEAGVVSTAAGDGDGFADGPGPQARFNHPVDVDVDSKGDIYVADTANGRIRKITAVAAAGD